MTQTASAGASARSAEIARRVRGLIAEARLRQVDLAAALGLSQAAFSRRIVGNTSFDIDEVQLLAPMLGVTEEYLFGFTNDRGPAGAVTVGYLRGLHVVKAPERGLAEVLAFPGRRAS